MTTVEVYKKNNSIYKVVCNGHTDYGIAGEDIVCAALSSVVQTALLGLLQIAVINVEYKADDKEGYFEMVLPDNLSSSKRHDADIILNTMLCGVKDLHEGYSDFVELEVH